LTKREELNAFIIRADELMGSQYILANVKIVNLLKTIACSDTLVAIFKSCLTDFDYEGAKSKYFTQSEYSSGKGEFVAPTQSRDLLALTFGVLMEIDGGTLDLGDLIGKYFYENGSLFEGYNAFLSGMIKPFKNTVVVLMESVIEGKIQDPIEAVMEEEKARSEKQKQDEIRQMKEKELAKKSLGNAIKTVRERLTADKKKIRESKLSDTAKTELNLIIDMLANVIDSEDREAINYAFVAYKLARKAHPILFFGGNGAFDGAIKQVIDAIK